MNDYKNFYQDVYSQDNPRDTSHGWIQWKGTDVCMDIHCKCGHHGHFDGDFLYYYSCPECGTKYAVGQVVKFIELSEEQVQYLDTSGWNFKTTEIE